MTSDLQGLAQGDTRLLDTEVAQSLLASSIPARVAYIARDGTPRIVSTWFHWTGDELVMPTFVWAPHVPQPAVRLKALQERPEVAVSIDTEGFPPHVLQIRGRATLEVIDGLADEYRSSAARYLGDEAAEQYLASIDVPGTRMARIAVRPAWVGVLDFETRLPGAMTV